MSAAAAAAGIQNASAAPAAGGLRASEATAEDRPDADRPDAARAQPDVDRPDAVTLDTGLRQTATGGRNRGATTADNRVPADVDRQEPGSLRPTTASAVDRRRAPCQRVPGEVDETKWCRRSSASADA
jgi:hypothetical protein